MCEVIEANLAPSTNQLPGANPSQTRRRSTRIGMEETCSITISTFHASTPCVTLRRNTKRLSQIKSCRGVHDEAHKSLFHRDIECDIGTVPPRQFDTAIHGGLGRSRADALWVRARCATVTPQDEQGLLLFASSIKEDTSAESAATTISVEVLTGLVKCREKPQNPNTPLKSPYIGSRHLIKVNTRTKPKERTCPRLGGVKAECGPNLYGTAA